MEAGGEISFDIRTPLPDDTIERHVRHALTLGLPELRDFEYPWGDDLSVIASGPSAKHATLGGKTLAINGALKLFTEKKIAPTYWIACDPQELVADFLDEIPAMTVYLVASKCHPKVFERLKDRTVLLWHVHDTPTAKLLEDRFPVARAVSVTICAFEVMARLGWRLFHTWGWDGCIMDGAENARPQANSGDRITVDVDGAEFPTTTTWALEAQDAAQALRGFPFQINIHGGGMMGEVLKLFLPSRIVTDLQ